MANSVFEFQPVEGGETTTTPGIQTIYPGWEMPTLPTLPGLGDSPYSGENLQYISQPGVRPNLSPEQIPAALQMLQVYRQQYDIHRQNNDWKALQDDMNNINRLMDTIPFSAWPTNKDAPGGNLLDWVTKTNVDLTSVLPWGGRPHPTTESFGASKVGDQAWMMPSYFSNPPRKLPAMSPMAAWAIAQLFPNVKAAEVPWEENYMSKGVTQPGRKWVDQPWQSPWEMGSNTGSPALRSYTINPAQQTGTTEAGQPKYEGGEYGQSVWYNPQAPSAQQYQELQRLGALPMLNAYLQDVGQVNPEDYWGAAKQYWPTSSGERRAPAYRSLPQK